QRVVAVAAENRVVARAAIDDEVDQVSQVAARREIVVAAVHIDDEPLACADVEEKWSWTNAVETDAAAVGRCGECFRTIAAIDLTRVVASPAFVDVVVVPRIPDHPVLPGLAEALVVCITAGQNVVAGTSK